MKRFLLLSFFVVGLMQANGNEDQEKEQVVDNIAAIVKAVSQGSYSQEAAKQELSFILEKYGKPTFAAIQNLFELVEQKLSTN